MTIIVNTTLKLDQSCWATVVETRVCPNTTLNTGYWSEVKLKIAEADIENVGQLSPCEIQTGVVAQYTPRSLWVCVVWPLIFAYLHWANTACWSWESLGSAPYFVVLFQLQDLGRFAGQQDLEPAAVSLVPGSKGHLVPSFLLLQISGLSTVF